MKIDSAEIERMQQLVERFNDEYSCTIERKMEILQIVELQIKNYKYFETMLLLIHLRKYLMEDILNEVET